MTHASLFHELPGLKKSRLAQQMSLCMASHQRTRKECSLNLQVSSKATQWLCRVCKWPHLSGFKTDVSCTAAVRMSSDVQTGKAVRPLHLKYTCIQST